MQFRFNEDIESIGFIIKHLETLKSNEKRAICKSKESISDDDISIRFCSNSSKILLSVYNRINDRIENLSSSSEEDHKEELDYLAYLKMGIEIFLQKSLYEEGFEFEDFMFYKY